MATRSSRRSSGRDTFNPAMIHLLDADRLRKELENRGLDTSGNRSVLADRLQEAVDRDKTARHSYSPPPVLEKPQSKRAGKRSFKLNAEAKNFGQLEAAPSGGSVKRKRITASANESAVEVIEESFSIQISEDDPDCSASSNRSIEDNTENVPVVNEESSEVKFEVKTEKLSPSKSTIKKLTVVGKKRSDSSFLDGAEGKESGLQLTISTEKPFGIKIKKIEVPPAAEVKKDTILKHISGGTGGKKKADKHSEKRSFHKDDSEKHLGAKGTTAEIVEEVSGKRYVKVDDDEFTSEKAANKNDYKHSKVLKLKLKLEHDKEPHLVNIHEKKETRKFSDVSSKRSRESSLEASSETMKRKLSKQNSVEKPKESGSLAEVEKKPEIDKKKDNIVRKKIPLRMQAVDVFDTIFDKQTELLSSKFKSEEERAAERQKIELAKRRQNSTQHPVVTAPPAPLERRRHTVEFNLSPQVFPSRGRLPPPPPPPLPVCGDSSFDTHGNMVPQRRLKSPPLPKRSVSFDEKPMSVILPAPPPPPVLVPRLPPPPPPPLPEVLSPSSTASDNSAPLSGRCSAASNSTTHDSPLLPTTSAAVDSNTVSASALHSPATLRSNSSSHSSPSSRKLDHSPLPSCSSSDPTTSSVVPPENSPSDVSVEKHTELPLQQIAKALCSVFAHIGIKNADLTDSAPNGAEANELNADSSENIACSGSAVNSEVTSTAVGKISSDDASELTESVVDVSAVHDVLNSVINEVLHLEELESVNEDLGEGDVVGLKVSEQHDAVDKTPSPTSMPMEVEPLAINGGTTPAATSGEKEMENDEKPNICEALMRDPAWLLQKASDIIKNLESQKSADSAVEEPQRQYEQISPGPDYEAGDEEKPLPAFYGEPVPDDDIVLEGSKRKPNLRKNVVQEEEPVPGDENIEIDFYNADLHIKASENNNFLIDPDNGDGFALMWGGARSNFGIRVPEDTSGFPKVVFQTKIKEFLPIIHLPFEELDPHDIRVGWSLGSTSNILGESPHSFAFSSLARKAVNSIFTDYGEPFHINDVITTVLDLARSEISYYKNDQYLDVAFSDLNLSPGDVIFPHICTKNCKVEVNFGDGEVSSWLALENLKLSDGEDNSGMKFMNSLDRKLLVRGSVPPPSKSDCTVLMMVGLPGVGKSTWVRQYLRDHPHEQWTLLSTDIIISAMKVNGIARSRVHQGRWDMIMGLTAKAMNRSLHLACRRRRNYIIDQTNVSREARRRKLSQFKDFQRKCVVIIPSEEEMLSRQARQVRVDGVSATPVEAMLELKASFAIPNIDNEPIEGVYFVEPPLERIGEAIELVNRFNEEARPWCQKKRGRRGDGRSGGGTSNDYSRSTERVSSGFPPKSSQASSEMTPPIINCESTGDVPQTSAQPSPEVLNRPNEGYCGFNGNAQPSLHTTSEGNGLISVPAMDPTVPPPNLWLERKQSFT